MPNVKLYMPYLGKIKRLTNFLSAVHQFNESCIGLKKFFATYNWMLASNLNLHWFEECNEWTYFSVICTSQRQPIQKKPKNVPDILANL